MGWDVGLGSWAGLTVQIRKKSTFPPPTFPKVRFSSLNFKIGQTTSLNFSNRAFYLPGAVLKAVCYSKRWYAVDLLQYPFLSFLFLIYFV
jgi:hypothetical protein